MWRYPSDRDLEENGLPTYIDMVFKTPLKWVYLFFIIFAIGIVFLVRHYNAKNEQIHKEKVANKKTIQK